VWPLWRARHWPGSGSAWDPRPPRGFVVVEGIRVVGICIFDEHATAKFPNAFLESWVHPSWLRATLSLGSLAQSPRRWWRACPGFGRWAWARCWRRRDKATYGAANFFSGAGDEWQPRGRSDSDEDCYGVDRRGRQWGVGRGGADAGPCIVG
jgi:hypothetical protein